MSDTIFKLRLLAALLRCSFEEWREQIWQRELDAPYCCGGHECGCMATTTRQLYSWQLERKS